MNPLPASRQDLALRGWDYVDIVLVTGDAYIDHPSFGVALIGRWLEYHGFKVAILAQPRHNTHEDFLIFGKPRLFFGISSGNLDSVVSNYTGQGHFRRKDAYSPDGCPYFSNEPSRQNRRRPDRALIIYSQLAKRAYKDVPVVLGGIEASTRRFIHYDYIQDKLRNSVLVDSKADILVYGMGELACLEIAKRLSQKKELDNISGTCLRFGPNTIKQIDTEYDKIYLPSFEKISKDKNRFLEAELLIEKNARAFGKSILLQQQKGGQFVVQMPPSRPLSQKELDFLYELPFTRRPHSTAKNTPAYKMIKDSITIVRGCSGNCSFCAISKHQGPIIVSRSIDSILREISHIASMPDFTGTITDLGGPTANLFGTRCQLDYKCKKKDCLFPRPCPNLLIDEHVFLKLLSKASKIKGVNHLFISSGLRMELLLKTPALFRKIVNDHTPGMLKIAPEHTEDEILNLMHKPGFKILKEFISKFRQLKGKKSTMQNISAYLMTSHPGCQTMHIRKMVSKLKELRLPVRKFQDFTPTPGTLSTAMYVSGRDTNFKKIFIPRKKKEKLEQRKLLEKYMKYGI